MSVRFYFHKTINQKPYYIEMKTYLPQEYVSATYNTYSKENLGAFIL
jgi:hypothetical protein